jgi:hypothetical protein
MKLMTVLALAGGFVAAPLIAAGTASALPPSWCDGAGCVPGVVHNASRGAQCVAATRYSFGLDSSGNTLVCTQGHVWILTRPLVGVRPLGAPCDGSTGSAQSPDGIPMSCKNAGWVADYSDILSSRTS